MFWVLFECRITPLHTISSLARDFHLGPESQFHPVCVSNYEKQNKPVRKGKSVLQCSSHYVCILPWSDKGPSIIFCLIQKQQPQTFEISSIFIGL